MHSDLPAGILPSDLDWSAVEALSQRYTLGVPELDEQHRILFAWYVALRSAPQLQRIAEGLNVYAARHFVDEEGWAADHGVEITDHQRLHNELLTRLDDLLNRADRLSAMSLLYDWLTTHVDIDDRKLVHEVACLDR